RRDLLLRRRRVIDERLARAFDERHAALHDLVGWAAEIERVRPAERRRLAIDHATAVGRSQEHVNRVQLFADRELRARLAVTGGPDEPRRVPSPACRAAI